MKGGIIKMTDFYRGTRYYRIRCFSDEDISESLDIPEEDMPEFMDDIFSSWMKLDKKTKRIERTATEAVKARKEQRECELGRAYERGYIQGYGSGLEQDRFDVEYEKDRKAITKQEEVEQDRDRREIDGETKTYNNFPTDEALDFDINVRERV